VGGILLGGESRRFGAPKQLALWRGVPFAEHVAAALAELVDDLLLLGAGEVPEALAGLRRVEDREGARGPLAGILAGLAAAEGALLAVACDQPAVGEEALRWLLDRRRDGALAVVARLGERGIEPFPALYEPAALEPLALLAKADGSLQPLALRPDVVVVEPPEALRRAWVSVDRPDALARLDGPMRG